MVASKRDVPDEEDVLKMADEHLVYEIDMYHKAARKIADPAVQRDPVVRNAVIESAAIHTRNLLKFFFDDRPRNSDMVAGDFFEKTEDWAAIQARVLNGATIDVILKRESKEVVHLTYDRLDVDPNDKGWRDPLNETHAILREAYHRFLANACESRLGHKLVEEKLRILREQ